MKQTKILGNQEPENLKEKLLRQAGEDKFIDAVIRKKKSKTDTGDFFKQFKQCQKAWELIHAIENSGNFDEEKGLYKYTIHGRETHYSACENISVALAYLAVGKIEEAEYLIMNVEKKIGFHKQYVSNITGDRGGLIITHDSSGDSWNIEDNSLLALAYLGLDGLGRATHQIEAIEANASMYDDLLFEKYQESTQEEPLEAVSGDNLAFALALGAINNTKEDASNYREQIEQVIGYDNNRVFDPEIPTGLIMGSNLDSSVFTDDNALLALVYMSIEDDLDKASKLIKGIEKHIGFNKDTWLANTYNGSSHTTIKGSALLVLAYMMQEFYRTK